MKTKLTLTTKNVSKSINQWLENNTVVKNTQVKKIYSKIVLIISVHSVVNLNSLIVKKEKLRNVSKNVTMPLNPMKSIFQAVSILTILNTHMVYGVMKTTKKKMKILTRNIVLGICALCVVRLYQSIYLKMLLKLKSNNVLKNVERNT